MSRVPVDVDEEAEAEDVAPEEEPRSKGKRSRRGPVDIEIEREVTKRHLIEAITSIVVVVLYMAFTLLRDRDAGVVVLDPDDERGPEDDWDEA